MKTIQTKAKEMLAQYLPDGATLYTVFVGRTNIAYRRLFFAVVDGRVVNVSLYISNLLGIRRDKFNNLVTRDSAGEITTNVAFHLERTLNSSNI